MKSSLLIFTGGQASANASVRNAVKPNRDRQHNKPPKDNERSQSLVSGPPPTRGGIIPISAIRGAYSASAARQEPQAIGVLSSSRRGGGILRGGPRRPYPDTPGAYREPLLDEVPASSRRGAPASRRVYRDGSQALKSEPPRGSGAIPRGGFRGGPGGANQCNGAFRGTTNYRNPGRSRGHSRGLHGNS